jgi:lipoprotein-releasing system ATP-binding protein
MSDVVLHCHQLIKQYQEGECELTVLKGVDFSIVRGESIAIVGASGSGKSTLLNLLGGLDQPSQGYVELLGHRYETLKEKQLAALRNKELGFVYQFHHLLSEFDALENVAMPLLIRGMPTRQAKAQAAVMLEKVGLRPRLNHRPSQLSGGERQRVAIARALVAHPSCVLMDEPTGNLDEVTATYIQDLLSQLNQELGICFILVTHDKQIAQRQQRIFLLHEGQLKEQKKHEFL